jgi:hypothetical protein
MVVALLGQLNAVVQAGTYYFHETFETLTIGDPILNTTPTPYGSWDVGVPVSGAVLAVVADPAGSGGQCLKFYDTSVTEKLRLKANWASAATESVRISYDLWIPPAPSYWNGMQTFVGNPSSSYTYLYTNIDGNQTTGTVKNYSNGTAVTTTLSTTLPTNTWLHYEMVFPAMPKWGYFTYHLTISAGGIVYFDGDLTSNWQDPANLSFLALYQPSSELKNNFYLDNIKVLSASTPRAANPEFFPAGGTYITNREVTLSCATPGAVIRYTTDGREPTTTSQEYSSSILITSSATIRAKVWAAGYDESDVVTVNYNIDEPTVYFHETFESLTIGDPILNTTSTPYGSWDVGVPASGAVLAVVADPVGNGGQCLKFYDTSVTEKLRLKANWAGNATESVRVSYDMLIPYLTHYHYMNAVQTFIGNPVSSYTYLYTFINVDQSVGTARNYSNGTTVTTPLSSTLPTNTWLHYEMVFPTMPKSGYFTYHLTISAGGIVYFDGDLTSNWESPAYLKYLALYQPEPESINELYFDNIKVLSASTPRADNPEFNPAGGTYLTNQEVTLSCATPGAVIRYTTDGREPTATSQEYSAESPILVTSPVTIRAKVWAAGYDESDVVSSSYKLFNRPQTITYGQATVDGNLVDWDDAEWIPLDQIYSKPLDVTEETFNNDIPSAFYAVRWGDNGNKVYVAVMVRDLMHKFSDTNTGWDKRDAVEIYLHTTGEGPLAYNATQADAQQYVVGFKTDASAVWSTIDEFDIPVEAGFQAAGSVDGDWLYYEVAMTPFKVFSKMGTGLEISTLSAGQVIGLDVCAVGHNGVKYVGMKSENTLPNKYNDYSSLGLHKLVAPLRVPGDANGDRKVDVGDLGILAANYGRDLQAQGVDPSLWWGLGDFNNDGKIDVGDLGILAANYGTNASGSDWSADYAKVFGTAVTDDESQEAGSVCSGLGLPLMAGLLLMGLMLVKIDE